MIEVILDGDTTIDIVMIATRCLNGLSEIGAIESHCKDSENAQGECPISQMMLLEGGTDGLPCEVYACER